MFQLMNRDSNQCRRSGFTLLETVIAIGVLAVLLTAFMAVFAPAADGIRRAISAQEADRLAYTLEKELVTLRDDGAGAGEYATGFEKAYEWIEESGADEDPLFLYQYRGNPDQLRQDGTMVPHRPQGDELGVAGEDFIVQSMLRRRSDRLLEEDLAALEGRVYLARLTQLVFSSGELILGTPGKIDDPTPNDGDGGVTDAESYPEAVIAFAAEFFQVPNTSADYIRDTFDPARLKRPLFTRNLAVRR